MAKDSKDRDSPLDRLTDDERPESPVEKLDRNWQEMLQELRVMQTGIQIITGFLLTLPFQQRFSELDDFQVVVYLVLVILSALTTVVLLTSVSMHRIFFRRHIRVVLVRNTDRILRGTLLLLGLVLMGTCWLIFDLVVGRSAGIVVAAALALVVLILWVVGPLLLRSKSQRRD
jgi:Family of unknown function (DUF6328)